MNFNSVINSLNFHSELNFKLMVKVFTLVQSFHQQPIFLLIRAQFTQRYLLAQ